MNEVPVSRSLFQRMRPSTLRVFTFILFPLAIIGQVAVVLSKWREGINTPGTFGLPNWVLLLCCIITIGFMTLALQTCWKELQSRKDN